MNVQIPDYFSGVVSNTRNAICDMLSDPTLWSETLVKETLTRSGSQALDIEDVQHIIKTYLTVLSDNMKKV